MVKILRRLGFFLGLFVIRRSYEIVLMKKRLNFDVLMKIVLTKSIFHGSGLQEQVFHVRSELERLETIPRLHGRTFCVLE